MNLCSHISLDFMDMNIHYSKYNQPLLFKKLDNYVYNLTHLHAIRIDLVYHFNSLNLASFKDL